MADDGGVPRETVWRVLMAHQIDQSINGTAAKLAKGSNPRDTLKVMDLPQTVKRRMLQHLARVYDVPIHHFYNPDMAPGMKAE